MAMDKLQEKIRKMKNPSVVDLCVNDGQIPPYLWEAESEPTAVYGRYYHELLTGLQGVVPAVRFSFSHFALMGAGGLSLLRDVTHVAREVGFYVLLDVPEASGILRAEDSAEKLFAEGCPWYFDGLITTVYGGSDVLKPYVAKLKESKKDLFVVLRTPNKSASQLQDMLSGSRMVYIAAADMASRQGAELVGRSGYSQVAGVGPASNADALKNLRSKNKNLFLLVDGYDGPGANAKNCSAAFDNLGHGAVVCAGSSITAAWREAGNAGMEYVALAKDAAERMKKNLLRYITVL